MFTLRKYAVYISQPVDQPTKELIISPASSSFVELPVLSAPVVSYSLYVLIDYSTT